VDVLAPADHAGPQATETAMKSLSARQHSKHCRASGNVAVFQAVHLGDNLRGAAGALVLDFALDQPPREAIRAWRPGATISLR